MLSAAAASAQECATGSALEAGARSAVEQAAQQYAQAAIQGNAAALQQSATGPLAASISPVSAALNEFKGDLSGAHAATRSVYLLDYSGQGQPEFYCGIFNSPDRTVMRINGLTPGKWAIVIEDVSGGKAPITIGEVLQQQGAAWKIAGFQLRNRQIGGHDSDWFEQKARDFKARGENHNAWFYYLAAWELAAPLPFMSTVASDKIAEEMQAVRPADLPAADKPLSLPAGGKTFQVSSIDTVPVGDVLDLRVRYKALAAASDTAQLYQDNTAVMKAVVEKYPEFRDGFSAIIARAMDPSGNGDYGSVAEMSKLAGATSASNPKQ